MMANRFQKANRVMVPVKEVLRGLRQEGREHSEIVATLVKLYGFSSEEAERQARRKEMT